MQCGVCNAPPELRRTIERLAQAGTPFRELARQSGFSKSALFRHSKWCMGHATLQRYRDSKPGKHTRLITRWAGSLTIQKTGERIAENDLLPNDVIIAVELETALAGNPSALFDSSGLSLEQIELHFRAREERRTKLVERRSDDPLPLPLDMRAIEQRPKESRQSQLETPVEPPKLLSVGFADLETKTISLRTKIRGLLAEK